MNAAYPPPDAAAATTLGVGVENGWPTFPA